MPHKDPEARRTYHRDYKRLRRAGLRQTPSQTRVPTEFRLKTAADVVALIEEQVRAVRDGRSVSTSERARTVGYLAGVALNQGSVARPDAGTAQSGR